MAFEVTLTLPNTLIEDAKQMADATQRDLPTILADTLEMIWPTLSNSPKSHTHGPISSLSDREVLTLADSKMDALQNSRLGQLQAEGKKKGLTEAEGLELLTLMRIYELGQLRKSEALAEAVQRGLRGPLSS